MLEVGAVVGARRQQHHRRIGDTRRDGAQIVEEQVGVVLYRRNQVPREELGKQPHHHLAVLDHVGHARGYPQIVLQNVRFSGACTNDVYAGDVRVDAGGNIDTDHLAAELGIVQHLLGRDAAGLENRLFVIDVVQKGVQRLHTLPQAGLELRPFGRGDDPGDDVEGDQALGPRLLSVNGKGDADTMESRVRLSPLALQPVSRHAGQPFGEGPIVRPQTGIRIVHLVVESCAHEAHRHSRSPRLQAGTVPCEATPCQPTAPRCRQTVDARERCIATGTRTFPVHYCQH
ncbi:MAG: hypothetical protein AW07_00998 [Candidatus Accumulibacter sp. SK-11]|nr:MAG: hypothetical protein AW07_00998 [Candidatus Accumulibacter sp. SK-11]